MAHFAIHIGDYCLYSASRQRYKERIFNLFESFRPDGEVVHILRGLGGVGKHKRAR